MGVYHAVWIAGCILFLPWLVSRMLLDSRYRTGLKQRTGRVPTLRSDRRVVWIHGVSVGEIMAAGTIIEQLQRSYPHLHLVISSTTPTGHEVARQQYGQHTIIYFPLDFGLFPGRALDRIAPSVVLLMELEIWPNFLQTASRRGIPVAVINGRISERSFRGYHLVRGLLPELDLITVFCVQDRSYQQRLLDLGVSPSKIHVTGNMKYDSVVLPAPGTQASDLRKWLAPDGGLVLVCGSTHGDEDLWLAEALGRVTAGLEQQVRLVLAPRHPERVPSVAERLAATGLECARWSERKTARDPLTPREVLLVDTIGQLQGFYAAGDVAFVGGSLVSHGGQNMLEPAALGKAVLFGPHTGNFARDVDLLIQANAAVQVRGLDELDSALGKLLRDAEWRRGLGSRAVAVIRENQGATGRTLSCLADLLGPPGLRRGASPLLSEEDASPESENDRQDQEQAECQDGQGH
jgi:3-deoxy-D-manno-octulosonic-acid transferase